MAGEGVNRGDVAEWLRREHQALTALGKVLREHIALMPEAGAPDWLRGLRAAFERLRAHLEQNFAAQEKGRFFQNLLDLRPTLSKQVERLRREHTELLRMADRIRAELAEIDAADRLLAADLSARIQRFLAVVAQHEQRESTITLLVFNEELGGGD